MGNTTPDDASHPTPDDPTPDDPAPGGPAPDGWRTDHLPTYPGPPLPPGHHERVAADAARSRRVRTLAMLAIVLPVAAGALAVTMMMGRLDSALLYVGIPCLIALMVGLINTDGDSGAQIFQVVTVALLLFAAFLQEGALCLLIASPLVYGIAYSVYGLTRIIQQTADPRHHALGVIGIVALGSLALEGSSSVLRVNPHQSVSASDVVAVDCSTFERALDRGPEFADEDRGWLLQITPYPVPSRAQGSGLEVGDTWSLAMPTGSIETEVTDRTDGRVDFAVTSDDARTTRWVTLTTAQLDWHQSDEGCEASVRIDFVRDLDPGFYFGPITHAFMTAGAEAFLAGLA